MGDPETWKLASSRDGMPTHTQNTTQHNTTQYNTSSLHSLAILPTGKCSPFLRVCLCGRRFVATKRRTFSRLPLPIKREISISDYFSERFICAVNVSVNLSSIPNGYTSFLSLSFSGRLFFYSCETESFLLIFPGGSFIVVLFRFVKVVDDLLFCSI